MQGAKSRPSSVTGEGDQHSLILFVVGAENVDRDQRNSGGDSIVHRYLQESLIILRNSGAGFVLAQSLVENV